MTLFPEKARTRGDAVRTTVLSTASIGVMATPGGALTARTLKGVLTDQRLRPQGVRQLRVAT